MKPYYADNLTSIFHGDCLQVLKTLPEKSVHCCVTSPPYFSQRDYHVEGQIGQENSMQEYIDNLVKIFTEVHRVLRDDGTLWLNLGDAYCSSPAGNKTPSQFWQKSRGRIARKEGDAPLKKKDFNGLKEKDLCMIPARVALALQSAGWYLRNDIIWHKNGMPESCTDRCTKAHEYVFLLSKKPNYFFDSEAIKTECKYPNDNRAAREREYDLSKEGINRLNPKSAKCYVKSNRRDVWQINIEPYMGAHFAAFPSALVKPCILAGTSFWGCCSNCGSPWERIVERTRLSRDEFPEDDERYRTSRYDAKQKAVIGIAGGNPGYTETKTLGWQPTCECYKEGLCEICEKKKTHCSMTHTPQLSGIWECSDCSPPAPCTVLDPFMGSGTTMAVAVGLNRKSVGIELNEDYIKLALSRIREAKSQPRVDDKILNSFFEIT